MGLWKNRRRSLAIGGASVAILAGVALIPSSAGSAPGPAANFTGIVGPGYVGTTCVARSGSGTTLAPVRIAVRGGGVGVTAGAKRIKVTFGGNTLPTVFLSAANVWEHTYPAGTPVPCTRARSNVKFQPVSPTGANIGKADTDTLNFTLCASPCN